MNFLINLFTITAFILVVLACGVTDPDSKFRSKPSALAKMNEIVVVTDEAMWNSDIGDTIHYLFGEVYPMTPTPEPTFDLRHFTTTDLYNKPLRRNLRTYLIVADLSQDSSAVTKMVKKDLGEERLKRTATDPDFHTSLGRDKWAVGQILIYVFAHGQEALIKAVKENYEGIAAKVNEHDANQLHEAVYSRGKKLNLIAQLQGRFSGAELAIPSDYKLALDKEEDDKLVWLRRDTRDAILNVVVREYPYTGPASINRSAMIENFNSFGIQYVESPQSNDNLIINDEDLPIVEFQRQIGGRYVKEYRGIWEFEKEFTGGSFISYLIVNENLGKFLQIDAIIMAPGKPKRKWMQQIDLIVSNTKWISAGQNEKVD